MTSYPGYNSFTDVMAANMEQKQSQSLNFRASMAPPDNLVTKKLHLFKQIQEHEDNLDNPLRLFLVAVLSGINGTLAN